MAKEEFDWIDDAFDDKKTADDMQKAKGPTLAVVLLAVVVIAAVLLVGFAFVAIGGSYQTS